jgi:hypothetical protein
MSSTPQPSVLWPTLIIRLHLLLFSFQLHANCRALHNYTLQEIVACPIEPLVNEASGPFPVSTFSLSELASRKMLL